MKTALKPSSVAIFVSLICGLVFLRSLSCGFINLDDPSYVVDNVSIRALDGNLVKWSFTEPLDFWIPLTFISLALDYHFWGLNPFGYHLTNVVLHAVNAGLVVLITHAVLQNRISAESSTGQRVFYAAALVLSGLFFGIHPLRVESVAWVTERKDVLNGVFTLSSILFYLKYARVRDAGGDKSSVRWLYISSIVCFALSLTAKSSSVVMPVMLLIADYYPMNRLKNGSSLQVIREKAPYFALSVAVAVLTLALGSNKQILLAYDYLPAFERITISGNAIFEYCRLLLYPVGIIPYFQIPTELPFSFLVKTMVVAIATVASIKWMRKAPLYFSAWIAFLLPFLPVLAFFQNGSQMLAARYTYLPSLVPSILLCTAMTAVCKKKDSTRWMYTTAICISALFVFYGGMTLKLIRVWDNTGTFWSRVIQVRPIGMAYKDRGIYLMRNGRYDAAISDFSRAIENEEIMQYVNAFNFFAFRALAYELSGRYREAIDDYSVAIAGHDNPTYYLRRGRLLLNIGRKVEGQEDLLRAGQAADQIQWYDR